MTLPLGSYHIEETKPPYGYIGTPESYDVTFAWDNERNDVVMATSIAKVDGAASSQSFEVVRSKDIVLATAAQCYAEVGNEEYLHQMALAVSVEVCGRLGISPPADAADRLNGLRAHIPLPGRSAARWRRCARWPRCLAIPSARNWTCSARAVICSAQRNADRHAPE